MFTLLSFRDTPVWLKYRDSLEGMPGADKVEYYLLRKGVVFDKANGDGVAVKADGTVYVNSQTDPTPVWPSYDDLDVADVDQQLQRLRAIKAGRDRLAAGTITATQRDQLLQALATQVLTLYRDPS